MEGFICVPILRWSFFSKFFYESAASLQSGDLVGTGVAPGLAAISVDKSVEFTLEELAKATDNFNLSFKIGQGGFGAVYYAELRGEVSRDSFFHPCYCWSTWNIKKLFDV